MVPIISVSQGSIFWVGTSDDGGKTWTNVYHGVMKGKYIFGVWADAPLGKTLDNGSLNLQIQPPSSLVRASATGPFLCPSWNKSTLPCNITASMIITGGNSLYATNPQTGDIYKYNGTPNNWTATGHP